MNNMSNWRETMIRVHQNRTSRNLEIFLIFPYSQLGVSSFLLRLQILPTSPFLSRSHPFPALSRFLQPYPAHLYSFLSREYAFPVEANLYLLSACPDNHIPRRRIPPFLPSASGDEFLRRPRLPGHPGHPMDRLQHALQLGRPIQRRYLVHHLRRPHHGHRRHQGDPVGLHLDHQRGQRHREGLLLHRPDAGPIQHPLQHLLDPRELLVDAQQHHRLQGQHGLRLYDQRPQGRLNINRLPRANAMAAI